MNTEALNTEAAQIKSVTEVVVEYARRWEELEPARLMELWTMAPDVAYIAVELDDVLVGSDAIHSHLARTRSRLTSVSVDLPRLWVRLVAPTIAIAVFVTRWELRRVETSTVSETHTRSTAVLRLREGQWRFIHYMEEPYYVEPGETEFSNFLDDIASPFRPPMPSSSEAS